MPNGYLTFLSVGDNIIINSFFCFHVFSHLKSISLFISINLELICIDLMYIHPREAVISHKAFRKLRSLLFAV